MNFKLNTFLKGGLTLLMIIMLGSFAIAQRTVKGKVTDASSGEALIGANVVAKGTSSGSVTDIDGMYSVNVPAGTSALEVSYAGYETQSITLGTSNVVDVALKAGRILEDVVVVGYGSVKKSDATGAVNAITEKDFNKGVIASPEQLLQGRVAGVQVSANSGEPGGAINIRIRGTGSITSSNDPLYVIDGVPLSGGEAADVSNANGLGRMAARNPLTFMNPNDIASIDILKDASATAIYGSRGANGVILITTKKAKEGKGTLEYGYSLGASSITKKYDLMSATEFAAANPTQDKKGNTDWQNEVFQTGLAHNHNLAFGAGTANSNFRFSLGYSNQNGIIKNSGLKRYTGNLNASQKLLNDRLTLGLSLQVSNTEDRFAPISENAGFVGDVLSAVLKSNPTLDVYKTVNGVQVLNQPGESEPTPVAILEYYLGKGNTLRTLGNINAEFKIADGLTFKTILGLDNTGTTRTDAFSKDLSMQSITGKGRAYYTQVNSLNKLMENYFNYNKKFGSVGFTGLLGYSYQNFDRVGLRAQGYDFSVSDPLLMTNNISSAKKFVSNSTGEYNELQSYFARVNFNISEKYLLTASFRRDGSTRFGPNNKYGNFPSFAAKWRLIQENFIPKNIFSDLGLRVGYGITGNQAIPHNVYDQRSRAATLDIDSGGNITGSGGVDNVSFASPDLKWEQTAATNIGLDFGFANNRVSGSIEFYDKNTTNLLFKNFAAQPAPNPFVWQNLDATVNNRGIELSLNIVAVDKKDFKWNISGNVARNKNLVKDDFKGLINTGEINGQGLTGAFAQRIAGGQPLFAYFLRDFGGFDAEGNSIYPNGDFQDFVGKSPLPTLTAGLTNTFSYKGLDLSIFFNGVYGHWIYSNTENAFFTKGALNNGRNVTKNVPDNGEGKWNAPDVSTRFLHKGDFTRLANLSLAYNLKPGIAQISNIRLFVSGQNILTFTKYPGQDPEVNVNKSIDNVPSFGIDYNAYPRAKTWTVGANVSF